MVRCYVVLMCPTELNGRLHSADEDAASWLTSYGSWHAYEKKKNVPNNEYYAQRKTIISPRILIIFVP